MFVIVCTKKRAPRVFLATSPAEAVQKFPPAEGDNHYAFSAAQEMGSVPSQVMVDLYNRANPATYIKKFSDRHVAQARTFIHLPKLVEPDEAFSAPAPKAPKPEKAPKEPKEPKELFGTKEGVLQNVLFCLEDRDKIVEAFRNYGLACWQVRSGGY